MKQTRKLIVRASLIAMGALACLNAKSQSALALSNLDEPTAMDEPIASDAWIHAQFGSGGNSEGYRLNSIILALGDATGSPSGFTVSIYEGFTEDTVDPLVKIADLSGADPLTAGLYAYDAVGLTLAPGGSYSLVVTADTPSSIGAFKWSVSDSRNFDADEGWFMNGSYDASINGVDWELDNRVRMLYAVNATAIPEPSTLALLGLGGLLVASRFRCPGRGS